MIKVKTYFFVQLNYFGIQRHKNGLVSFKKFCYILINYTFAVLRMVNVRLNKTTIAYHLVMLPTEFRSNLFRVSVTKDQRYLYAIFDLFFDMFIRVSVAVSDHVIYLIIYRLFLGKRQKVYFILVFMDILNFI